MSKNAQLIQKRRSKAAARQEMNQFVTLHRAMKEATIGHPDLPDDPLGRALGQNEITRSQYDAGRRYEELMTFVYGQPHAKTASFSSGGAGNGATTETLQDVERQKLLSQINCALRSVRRLDIVKSMCWLHEARQNKYYALRQGLDAILEMQPVEATL